MDCMSREQGEYDEDSSDSGGEDASDSGEDDEGGTPGGGIGDTEGVEIGLDDLGSHVITDRSSMKGLLARLALLNARWP